VTAPSRCPGSQSRQARAGPKAARTTRANLGSKLALYQVHSLTEDSGVIGDTALLAAMARLRSNGVMIGLITSGPLQATTLRRALDTAHG
jgi:hypothetical protein